MTAAGLWQRAWWPLRTAATVWWAGLNQRDLAPVPAAMTIKEVSDGARLISAAYRPDPLNGLMDYSEDPRRVQYHLERGTLGFLPGLDCDDLAYWAVARLRDLANPAHVLVLTDETGKYSHAVCEAWVDGHHVVIDTNGTHYMAGWASVSQLMTSIYPDARYRDELRVDYPFPDAGRA